MLRQSQIPVQVSNAYSRFLFLVRTYRPGGGVHWSLGRTSGSTDEMIPNWLTVLGYLLSQEQTLPHSASVGGAYWGIPMAIEERHIPEPSGNSSLSAREVSDGRREDLPQEPALQRCTVRHKRDPLFSLVALPCWTSWRFSCYQFLFGIYRFKFLKEPYCPMSSLLWSPLDTQFRLTVFLFFF